MKSDIVKDSSLEEGSHNESRVDESRTADGNKISRARSRAEEEKRGERSTAKRIGHDRREKSGGRR